MNDIYFQRSTLATASGLLQRCVAWSALSAWLTVATPGQVEAVFFELFHVPTGDADDVPSYDPDGQHLVAIMNVAAGIWSDVIKDDHDIRIHYHWEDMEDNSGQMIGSTVKVDNYGRIIEATIRFNKNRKFWIDPTPEDHSEFDMTSTLYRDLDAARQVFWYDGEVPDTLEVGFGGTRKPETVANQGFPDVNGLKLDEAERDLLTLALHELGHGLGVNEQVQKGQDEIEDGKYDIDPALVGGLSFDVFSESTENSHLNPSVLTSPVLMYGGNLGDFSFRRLPSAVDVVAMGTVNDWTNIDLLRQDWLAGSGFWDAGEGEPQGWIGGNPPDDEDDAFIRNGAEVSLLDPGGHVQSLSLDGNSTVSVSSFDLAVDDRLIIEGGSRVEIAGGTITARELLVSGELIGHGDLFLLTGSNTIDGPGGRIAATDGQTLTVGGNFDLTLTSTLEAIDGNLQLAQTTVLNGHLKVGGGRVADVGPMTVGPIGLITLDGSGPSIATLNLAGLETVEIQGGLNVVADAVVAGRAIIGPGAEINVPTNGDLRFTDVTAIQGGDITVAPFSAVHYEAPTTISGGVHELANNVLLQFSAPTEYAGGTIIGDGDIHHNANVLVSNDVTITANVFDMDGSPDAANHFFTVAAGAYFTLHANKIENTALVDDYDGTLTVRGRATFDVGSQWRLDGELVLDPDGPGVAELLGSKTVIEGKLTVGGQAVVLADIGFTTTSDVDVGPGAELDLRGNTTYNGGSFQNLGGVIKQTGDAEVIGSTAIFAERFDLDGGFEDAAITIVDAAKFSLTVDHLDTSSFADRFDGKLNIAGEMFVINEPDEWTMAGDLCFDDGIVSGSKVIVTGNVTGNGVFSSVVTNQGQIAPTPIDPDDGSPGGLTFEDLAHEPGGVIRLEIGGNTGGLHDQLNVLGDLTLRGGDLDLVFVDGFAPSRGQTFDLITVGGSAIGDFQEVNIVNLAEGFQFDTNLITAGGVAVYQFTAISNAVFLSETAGDYNDDGIVDAADYVVWRDDLGAPPGTLPNDIDGGPISHAHYETWRTNFGRIVGRGPMGAAPVPEPSSGQIYLIAVCCGTWLRRRHDGEFTGG